LKHGRGADRRPPTKSDVKERLITMFALIAVAALVLAVFVALAVVGFALHVLFSPWLLVAVVAVVAWLKFGPRRSRR
jgi:hypothetical protein